MDTLEIRKHQFAKFAYNSGLKYGTKSYRLAESAFFSGVLCEHHGHTGKMPPLVSINIMSGRPFLTKQEQETLQHKGLEL
jgi:hypothetical protein